VGSSPFKYEYILIIMEIKLFENFTEENFKKMMDEQDKNNSDSYGYEFIEMVREIKESTEEAIKIFESHLKVFPRITVKLAEDLYTHKDCLAFYSHESAVSSHPFIVLNYKEITNMYEEGYSIDTIIKTTIYHELGHAMVDIDNAYIFIEGSNIFQFQDEEIFVEDFAFNLFNFNKVDPIFKEFEKHVKRFDNEDIEMDDNYYM
jgi:hypothetical protein